MEFHRRIPGAPLDRFVSLLWHCRGPAQPHAFDRILPDGDIGLIVNLAEDQTRVYDSFNLSRVKTLSGCVLVGAHSESFVIDTAEEQWVMGAEFHPAGAVPFLGMPAGEVEGMHVPLDDLWRRCGRQLRERVLEAPTADARLRILEQVLAERVARVPEGHPAVLYALDEFGRGPRVRTIAEVTGRVGMSARRFIERFRNEVGMTPKRFCRVRRFQQALRLIGAGKRVEWTDVALDCGYFDQPHFIHDFRAFAGMSPTEYAARRGPYQNHVAITAANDC
jgi:AraC-like DNA-binding protein